MENSYLRWTVPITVLVKCQQADVKVYIKNLKWYLSYIQTGSVSLQTQDTICLCCGDNHSPI